MSRTPPRTAPTATLADLPLADGAAPQAPAARVVRCDGVDLSIRHTPGGEHAEPAVMVHGLGGSALNWTDLAHQSRPYLDTDAIDLPGHGLSGPSRDGRYRLQDHTGTVIAYLEQSGRGPVHLFGNSMGGAISILVAAQRPDLVRTLTLVSPAVPDVKRWRVHPLKHDPRMIVMAVPGLGELALRRTARRVPADKRVAMLIRLCFGDPDRYPGPRLAEDVEQTRARLSMPWADEAFLRSTRGLGRSQFAAPRVAWQAMRAITAPTLVVWGTCDRLVAPDLLGYVAAAIPDSRQLMLDGVGHTAQMEDPRTVARAFVAMRSAVAL
ncbi:MAG: alpha/beta hydrolase [Jatrophihabitans sp.]|nr:MAG: alpha/beta hydrolase [Jatrophihabitans sp.]